MGYAEQVVAKNEPDPKLVQGLLTLLNTFPPGVIDTLNRDGGTIIVSVCALTEDAAKSDADPYGPKDDLPDVTVAHELMGVLGAGHTPETSKRFMGEDGKVEANSARLSIAQDILMTAGMELGMTPKQTLTHLALGLQAAGAWG